MKHLLVTNDFPPKVGGIQSYLWELWRRLPPEKVTVLTTPHHDASRFDRAQPFRVDRDRHRVLVPVPALARRIDALAVEAGASLVVLDPALPVGLIGPRLRLPYALVLHGAEVVVPGRLPGSRALLRRVLRGAALVIAAGRYVAEEAERVAGCTLPSVTIPPGVDTHRFQPLDDDQRALSRDRLGLPVEGRLVVGVSRLVPRKGFDVLIAAAARLGAARSDLTVAVAGTGRCAGRLRRLAAGKGAPVYLLGRVSDEQLPLLVGAADVFAVPCRNRWAGLEQEGFGIVFLEAAAAGVPAVAGRSGGTAEAVDDGCTGVVVDRPGDPAAVTAALARLVDDPTLAHRMGAEGRRRAVADFDYDGLASQLEAALTTAVR